jgi:hypothetical protein
VKAPSTDSMLDFIIAGMKERAAAMVAEHAETLTVINELENERAEFVTARTERDELVAERDAARAALSKAIIDRDAACAEVACVRDDHDAFRGLLAEALEILQEVKGGPDEEALLFRIRHELARIRGIVLDVVSPCCERDTDRDGNCDRHLTHAELVRRGVV